MWEPGARIRLVTFLAMQPPAGLFSLHDFVLDRHLSSATHRRRTLNPRVIVIRDSFRSPGRDLGLYETHAGYLGAASVHRMKTQTLVPALSFWTHSDSTDHLSFEIA